MKFSIQDALPILERTPQVISTLLKNLPDNWIYCNEGGETWSAFDIVGHYIHGEKTDWIPRMKIILSDTTNKRFVPFDRFAQFNESKGKTLDQLLDEFANLRKENIAELKKIPFTEDLLSQKAMHPELGEVTLSHLLATWVVHDLNHIHQICRVMSTQYENEIGPWKPYLGILNSR